MTARLITAWLASLGILYVLFAFVAWDSNAGHWDIMLRSLFAFLAATQTVGFAGYALSEPS